MVGSMASYHGGCDCDCDVTGGPYVNVLGLSPLTCEWWHCIAKQGWWVEATQQRTGWPIGRKSAQQASMAGEVVGA